MILFDFVSDEKKIRKIKEIVGNEELGHTNSKKKTPLAHTTLWPTFQFNPTKEKNKTKTKILNPAPLVRST